MLDRLNGADQAGEGFDLLLNPFVLLRVGLEADPREINRAYEDAAESGAATIDILQRAQQALLTPRLRVDAEVGAFFDTAAALAVQTVDLLAAGTGGKRLDDLLARLSPLVRYNVRAHLASRKPASVSELTALLRAQAATSPAAIRVVIETTRHKARCGQIEPDGVVDALGRLQRRQCRAAIDKLVEAPGYAGAFTGLRKGVSICRKRSAIRIARKSARRCNRCCASGRTAIFPTSTSSPAIWPTGR